MADGRFVAEVVSDTSRAFSSVGTMQSPAGKGKNAHLRYQKQRLDVDVTQDYLSSLSLLESDLNLVNYLGEIGYVTTEQVSRMYYALHKAPLKSAQKRLIQLWKWHLLERSPCTGLEKYGLQPQLVYSLGKAGNLMLSESDAEGTKRRKPRGKVLMLHNILLGEMLIGLMTKGRKKEWNLSFRGERSSAVQFEYNERRIKMRPDGLLFFNNDAKNIETPVFVELDT